MKIQADEILEELRRPFSEKTRTSIHVSADILEEFKAACEEVPVSNVLEKLMSIFIDSKKAPK